ncbi:YdaS family helix-turn-helix protein [Neptuniibacter pectenicola]|uniref:YdaS family helix-turn-helix protein n=1 Tax=Neptuniibacter pectenicola TaxID=1806669 RepID=UPI00082A818A|nr:YdaS family helix-turn-helix protein [Neptuniibacter pectenicola]
MNKIEALKKAVDLAGGQEALAEKVTALAHSANALPPHKKIKQQHVFNWIHREKQCAAKWAGFVSLAVNGGVPASLLRPDLYPVPHEV